MLSLDIKNISLFVVKSIDKRIFAEKTENIGEKISKMREILRFLIKKRAYSVK